ncbi:hypothetical protein [Streptomyces sp. NPDC101145]|uniref:hypothetical protein n=1 Tax=Streptomyces sp. NPDC101145 TaxID=3366112 RepID=UPI0037FDA73F
MTDQPIHDEMPDTWVRAVADAIETHGHQIADAHESAIAIRLTPQQRRTLHAETEPYLVISWRGDDTGTGALDRGISPDGAHVPHPQPITDTTNPNTIARTVDTLLRTGQPA